MLRGRTIMMRTPASRDIRSDMRNVPTCVSSVGSPATARFQVDFVFASWEFHQTGLLLAMTSVEEMGASSRCRLMIEALAEPSTHDRG